LLDEIRISIEKNYVDTRIVCIHKSIHNCIEIILKSPRSHGTARKIVG